MGVDFTSYSRVKSEPVPERFRAKRLPVSVSDADRKDFDNELRYEFYGTIGREEDFITVNWDTNIIYRKTPETKIGSASRSYDGYGEFLSKLTKLNGGHRSYMPPDTDIAPENGIVSTERCITCLQGLERVRSHFVSPSFVADPEKYGNSYEHRLYTESVPEEDNIHDDSWFFREFYSMMSVATDSGIVSIW